MSHLRMRALLTSVALVASAGAVVLATDASVSAASSNVITTTSPGKPIASEKFIVRGKLATAVERPVQLQRKTTSGWKKVTSGATTPDGKFAITTSTTAKKTYRVYAQKVTIGDKTYGARTTTKRTVKPVSQKVTTSVSRTKVDVSKGQSLSVSLKASPVRKGRAFELRVTFEGDPYTSPVGVQNSKGRLTVDFGKPPAGAVGTYKVQGIVKAANGAPRKVGNVATFKVVK